MKEKEMEEKLTLLQTESELQKLKIRDYERIQEQLKSELWNRDEQIRELQKINRHSSHVHGTTAESAQQQQLYAQKLEAKEN